MKCLVHNVCHRQTHSSDNRCGIYATMAGCKRSYDGCYVQCIKCEFTIVRNISVRF